MLSTRNLQRAALAALALAALIGPPAAQSQARTRLTHMAGAEGERPLVIRPHRHAARSGLYRDGDHVVAVGGFSANGFGYGSPDTEAGRRAVRNAEVRAVTSGIYGYGADGLGGAGISNLEDGYNNPSYGGAFNRYVGYNGVPTNLAFGPDFAFRRYADQDGDDASDVSWPSPEELGYRSNAVPSADE